MIGLNIFSAHISLSDNLQLMLIVDGQTLMGNTIFRYWHKIMASTASSRRNSTVASSVGGGSRRGSVDSDGGFPFRLKKSKPVSQVKIVFMGKPLVI